MKITEKIFNIETGEEQIIEREETAEEVARREQAEINRIAADTEAATMAELRASANAKLAALGLTSEEIAALIK